MVKTGGIKTQKPEKSMFRTNANNVLRQSRDERKLVSLLWREDWDENDVRWRLGTVIAKRSEGRTDSLFDYIFELICNNSNYMALSLM